jgi:hypothetical protein
MSNGKQIYYIAIYHVELAKGGNEEGGWWYDVGEPVPNRRLWQTTNKEKAYSIARRLNDLLHSRVNKYRRPKSSVLSDGVFEAHMTEELPAPFPQERPYYE